jgi:hypothetical protein
MTARTGVAVIASPTLRVYATEHERMLAEWIISKGFGTKDVIGRAAVDVFDPA